jgi:hypothetical protein
MRSGLKLKFWFFEHSWWMLCLVFASTLAVLLWRNEPLPTVATIVGALLSLIYFVQKQKLEELRLFRELFKEFNARYNKMNEKLARIVEATETEVSKQERETLIDYFNLCGEEYLYYERGYIYPVVWKAWLNGMKANISAPRVLRVWQVEKQTESYYDLPL